MQSLNLSALHTFPHGQVHYADPFICIASIGLALYISHDQGRNWVPYAAIPSSWPQRWFVRHYLYQRLVRGGVNSILPWKTPSSIATDAGPDTGNLPATHQPEWIAMSRGALYRVTADGQQVSHLWTLKNGRRTLRQGMSIIGENLYIGDYWANPQRLPVNIYRINLKTEKAETFYQFSAGTIRHIHNVEVDPYSGSLWFSTGDEDAECQISYLDPESGQLTCIGQGNQQWRAVSFIFRKESVLWGTDNPNGENQIWLYERKSGKLHLIGPVKGPVYYCKSTQDYVVFGTAVEFGHGDQDRYGRLYAAQVTQHGQALETEAIALQEVLRCPKDAWHPRYFGYGLFELNAGDIGNNQFWATSKGFRGGLRSTLFDLNSLTSNTQ